MLDHYGMTYADGGFVCRRDRSYGAGWADVGAACAFGAAVAVVEVHFGLHEGLEVGRWVENVVGAFGHTELARGAMFGEMAKADGAGRFERCGEFGKDFVLDYSQSAIDVFLLCM